MGASRVEAAGVARPPAPVPALAAGHHHHHRHRRHGDLASRSLQQTTRGNRRTPRTQEVEPRPLILVREPRPLILVQEPRPHILELELRPVTQELELPPLTQVLDPLPLTQAPEPRPLIQAGLCSQTRGPIRVECTQGGLIPTHPRVATQARAITQGLAATLTGGTLQVGPLTQLGDHTLGTQ